MSERIKYKFQNIVTRSTLAVIVAAGAGCDIRNNTPEEPKSCYFYTAKYDPTLSTPNSGDEFVASGAICQSAIEKATVNDCPPTRSYLIGLVGFPSFPVFGSADLIPDSCIISQ